MGISNVTETQKVSAPPAPPVAPAPQAPAATEPSQEKKDTAHAEPVSKPAPPPPPPPPPPVEGYDIEVVTGEHQATGHRVYGFVEPDSGEVLVQIPIDNVLNLVAQIVAKLEAEGRA
jgi:hypothetical protein